MPYYQLRKGTTNKFWDIKHTSKITFRVIYGKIGSMGTKKSFEFKDTKERNKNYKNLIDSILKKGYKKVLMSKLKKNNLKHKIKRTAKKASAKPLKKETKKKECPTGKQVNPKTGRCIKMKLRSGTVKKECPRGKEVNPKTGRCIKMKLRSGTVKKECPPGKEVNPKTGRCVKMKLRSESKNADVNSRKVWNVLRDGVMLAHTYKDPRTGKLTSPPKGTPEAPKGWYVSEKYDGYRAIWDGENFISRHGKPFNAAESFKKWFPKDIALDGELFIGRELFEKHGVLRKKEVADGEWEKAGVKFNVFDSPSMLGNFETRMKKLKSLVKKLCSKKCPIKLVSQIKVKNEAEMMEMFESLVAKGAEGVMLRAPNSPYEPKRSKYLLKVKQLFDTECRVIGYKKGTGKYKGMLGAFECALVSNPKITFTISGMNDEIRKNYKKTHPLGTLVTFTYMGVSKGGVPRHPVYLRKRI